MTNKRQPRQATNRKRANRKNRQRPKKSIDRKRRDERLSNGRFAKGCRPGPGRPKQLAPPAAVVELTAFDVAQQAERLTALEQLAASASKKFPPNIAGLVIHSARKQMAIARKLLLGEDPTLDELTAAEHAKHRVAQRDNATSTEEPASSRSQPPAG